METKPYSFWPVIAPVIILAMLVAATLIRPGDAPWIYDEPLLMEMALHQNAIPAHFAGISVPFTPSPFGLLGTRGIRYGPLAVWIDQIFLAFTRNPILMLAVRAGVVSSLNAAALYWLCKTLRLTPWLAVVAMLSPWLWIYSRQLWDNSLAIPLSAMMLASYADFLASRRAWSLRLVALCAMLLVLIHFMALPLILAIAIHLGIFERRSLWRFKWIVAGIVLAITALSAPYWIYLFRNDQLQNPGGTSVWRGWVYPLFGAHHLSAAGLRNILGDGWQNTAPKFVRPLLRAAQGLTLVAYPASWVGILLAIRRIWRWKTTSDHLLAIALATIVFQCIQDGLQHAYVGPHYYNATWIAFVPLVWLAAQEVFRYLGRAIATALLAAYAAAMLLVLTTIAVTIADNGGTRSPNYGTAISNQISAVNDIQKFSSESPRQINFAEWSDHPRTPAVLEDLLPPPAGARPMRQLTIQYRDATPNDARIEVQSH